MNEEEKTLNLDDVKFLLEISEEKEWDKQFYMHNNAPEEQKATYNECILYLEKLAGEKHDN